MLLVIEIVIVWAVGERGGSEISVKIVRCGGGGGGGRI